MSTQDRRELDAAHAVDELRRAEAKLARRRQTLCGPSESDRSAMRFILERDDDGLTTSPSELADFLDVSSASITSLIERLTNAGLISTRPDTRDKWRKIIVPMDRSMDADDIDPLSATIRNLASDLSPQEAELVTLFLNRVAHAVNTECTPS